MNSASLRRLGGFHKILSNSAKFSNSTRALAKLSSRRTFSASSEKPSSEVIKRNADDYDDFDYEPKTAGQKVAYYTQFFGRLALLLIGGTCAFFTFRELMPSRMKPNSLFNEVFDMIRINDDVCVITGDQMRGYGRETGGNTEGRRNHIDSYEYKERDGSNRVRIRFNVKGQRGHAYVWAEVSDKMSSGYVYVVVQDTRTGRVHTVTDNRSRLDAEMEAPSEDQKDAMSKLLGYFDK